MSLLWRKSFAALAFAAVTIPINAQNITLLGKGSVAGDATDLSGLTGNICQAADPTVCAPHNTFGGWGSGIAYTGHDNAYVGVSDRGFYDGVTDKDYLDRFHILWMKLDMSQPLDSRIRFKLLDTRFLKNEVGKTFVGQSGAYNVVSPLSALRFDPEGVQIGRNKNFYVSDEYGPAVLEFNRRGRLVRRIHVPSRFLIDNPTNQVSPTELPPTNTSGRQANRGMEGLAISPDGRTLFGIMQNALIQDGALNSSNSRRGLNNRILQIDLVTGETHEYAYQLYSSSNGVNEIVAINDREFLLVERDGRKPSDSNWSTAFKKIIHIDIDGATDVSDDVLPQTGTTFAPGGPHAGQTFIPVAKSVFLDLRDPAFGLDDANFPEKIEGLTWGPDMEDGTHVLYVASDNDLVPTAPSIIWAFGIPEDMLKNFHPQILHRGFFPPGQVRKALRDKNEGYRNKEEEDDDEEDK